MKTGPWIVNVGLPRTGTSSFARATELLGFRSLHIWSKAEESPALLASFQSNDPESRRFVSAYDTLSDTPFYALRDTFERHYPETRILYTTRPKRDWVRSILSNPMAGGEFLARLYGLRDAPYAERHRESLERLYERHHTEVCHGISAIDLGLADDRAKWELLCAGLPDPETALKRSIGLEWPRENRSPGPR